MHEQPISDVYYATAITAVTVNRPIRIEYRSVTNRSKHKYDNSFRREDGVLILSSRKRARPTAEEKEIRKQRKIEIKTVQLVKSDLQHTVINLYEHGVFFPRLEISSKIQ